MSVVTKEEIEHEVHRTGHYFSSAGMIRDVDAVALCARVAALVEERMKEMVCSVCGESSSDGDCCNYRTQVAPVTRAEREVRAQYEAEKGGGK